MLLIKIFCGLAFDGPFLSTLDKFQSPFTLSSQSILSNENFVLCLTFFTHCKNQQVMLFLAMHSWNYLKLDLSLFALWVECREVLMQLYKSSFHANEVEWQ